MVLKSSALREYTEEKRKKWGIPAVSVALHNGGSQGFGRTSNGDVTADTVMPIASNTKLFTAVALGTLVDEGKLQWDTKVCEVLDGFTLSNEHTASFVTEEDLLCHRTGITRTSMMYGYTSHSTSKDILKSVQQAPCHSQLRQQYSYDNSGYAIAACIIARVSGQGYAAFVESRILQPLGMSRSGFDPHKAEPYAALPSVTLDDGTTTRELPFYQAEWASDHAWEAPAGLFSTASDLNKWISYLQRTVADANTAGDPKIISTAGFKELIRPRIVGDGQLNFYGKSGVSAFPEFSVGLYGLGICQFQIHGINVACHLGGSLGAASVTLWTPDRDFAMVSLANQGHRGNSVTCMIALRAFEEHFGLPHADWEARMLARDELWKTGPSVLPSGISYASEPGPLADLLGRYSAPGQPDLFILDSKTSDSKAVPAEIADFWAWRDTVEVFGRPAFESDLVACWSVRSLFERFARLKHLGDNVYFADWYCCVGGRKGIDGVVISYSSAMGQQGNLFYLIEKEGKIHLELKKSWEKVIPKVKLGDGEMTLTRQDQ